MLPFLSSRRIANCKMQDAKCKLLPPPVNRPMRFTSTTHTATYAPPYPATTYVKQIQTFHQTMKRFTQAKTPTTAPPEPFFLFGGAGRAVADLGKAPQLLGMGRIISTLIT